MGVNGADSVGAGARSSVLPSAPPDSSVGARVGSSLDDPPLNEVKPDLSVLSVPVAETAVSPTTPQRTSKAADRQSEALSSAEEWANRAALGLATALTLGDRRRALDAVHGLPSEAFPDIGGMVMKEFEGFTGEGSKLLLQKFSSAERVLFDAYLMRGYANPEDIAFIAIDGYGTGENVLNNIYHDLWRGSGGDRETYETLVTEMETRFAKTYGSSLTSLVINRELSKSEGREFRAARVQNPQALHLDKSFRGWFKRPDDVLDILEQVVENTVKQYHRQQDDQDGDAETVSLDALLRENLAQLSKDYAYVRSGGSDPTALFSDVRKHLKGAALQRFEILFDPGSSFRERIIAYTRVTVEGTATGDLHAEDALRVLQRFIGRRLDGPGWRDLALSPETLSQLKEQPDPELRAIIDEFAFSEYISPTWANRAHFEKLVAPLRKDIVFVQELTGHVLTLARFLESLPPDRLADLSPWIDLRDLIGEDRSPHAFERLHAIQDLGNRLYVINQRRHSELDPITTLQQAIAEGSSLSDTLDAIGSAEPSQRSNFSADFDARFGPGSYEKIPPALNKRQQYELGVMLAADERELADDVDETKRVQAHKYTMTILHAFEGKAARPDEVLAALQQTAATDRATLEVDYDKRYGEGSFAKIISRFKKRDRDAFEMIMSVPAYVTQEGVESFYDSLETIVGSQRNRGWHARLMDTFGFSGPVLDDSLRALRLSANRVAAKQERGEEVSPDDIAQIFLARERLSDALVAYYEEQGELGDAAANTAMIVVGVATIGAGVWVAAGATAVRGSVVVVGSAVMGGAANTARAPFQVSTYSWGEAGKDFATGAALELVVGGAAGAAVGPGLKLAGRGINPAKKSVRFVWKTAKISSPFLAPAGYSFAPTYDVGFELGTIPEEVNEESQE